MFYIVHRPECPWCDKAIDLIEAETDEDFSLVNIYENKLIWNLFRLAQLTTVPQIWYDDEYIGGYQELVNWLKEKEN